MAKYEVTLISQLTKQDFGRIEADQVGQEEVDFGFDNFDSNLCAFVCYGGEPRAPLFIQREGEPPTFTAMKSRLSDGY